MFLHFLPQLLVLLFAVLGINRVPVVAARIKTASTNQLRTAVLFFSFVGIAASARGLAWAHILAWSIAALFSFLCVKRLGRNALGWLVVAIVVPRLFFLPMAGTVPYLYQSHLIYLLAPIPYLVLIISALLSDKSKMPVRPYASQVVSAGVAGVVKPVEAKPPAVVPTQQSRLNDVVAQRQLRPLGNKKRLGFVEGKGCNDYRAQFRDKASAIRYFDTFVKFAERNPPPYLIEVMVAYTPNTIYSEKYSFILPYFNVGVREDYQKWGREAIQACTDVMRQHSYSAGNSYEYVPKSISAQGAVIKWVILPPRGFDPESAEAQELLSDPPEMGFATVNIEGQGAAVPDKPNPTGPWIGVLFEISKFSEALYGRAATKQLLAMAGEQGLAGCVIHGGDILPDCQYWCNAIHTATQAQADIIEAAVTKSGNEKLAQGRSPVIHGQQVPVNTLPFQGFVAKDGVYVGN